jgi:hypothetical protein
MTNEQWLACTDPWPMLEFLRGRANDRKLRLFAVACCRRAWRLLTDPRHRGTVEAAERFADGLLSEAEFDATFQPVIALWVDLPDARKGAWEPSHYMTGATRHLDSGGGSPYAASYAARGLACLAGPEESPEWSAACRAEGAVQSELVRDLFGDPSRPFQFEPDWLAGAGRLAVERARAIYRAGNFESLRLLAGVLEQAGCRDRAVLEHCRGAGPHARGCWVVDALLGREPAVRTGLVTEADWRACEDPEPLLHFLRDKGSNRKWRLFAVACCCRIDHLLTDDRSRRSVEVAARYADGAATEEELAAARSVAQQAQDEAQRADYRAEAEANFCITPERAAACCRLHAASAARSAVCRDPRVTAAEPGSFEAEYWQPSNGRAAAAATDQAEAQAGGEQGGGREEARQAGAAAGAAELRAQCELLRDLFGEYLGPPGEEGGWLPSAVGKAEHPLSQAEQWCLLPTPRNLVVRPEWLAWGDGTVAGIARSVYEEQAFDRLPILADALEDAGCADNDLLAHLRGPGPHARGCVVLDRLLGKE